LKTNSDQNFVFLHVKDNGAGIPDSVLSKIFEPFFTTKKEKAGTGLGLSLSQSIIRKYDGDIKIESKLGSGIIVMI
jgi:signal transduction histidine kinase